MENMIEQELKAFRPKMFSHHVVKERLDVCVNIANSAEKKHLEFMATNNYSLLSNEHKQFKMYSLIKEIQKINDFFIQKYKYHRDFVFSDFSSAVIDMYSAEEKAKQLTDFSM